MHIIELLQQASVDIPDLTKCTETTGTDPGRRFGGWGGGGSYTRSCSTSSTKLKVVMV